MSAVPEPAPTDDPTPGGPDAFTANLWRSAAPIQAAILAHPFLAGLTDGTLPEDTFRTYVVQDSHYLKGFARALALTAGRAEADDEIVFLATAGAEAITVEHELHAGFIADFGLSPAEVAATPRSPTTQAYVDFMLAHAAAGSSADGLAAVLACFWIYREVGRALLTEGSPDPRYGRWIDTYASDEFSAQVDALLTIVDRRADGLGAAGRERFRETWLTGCRYEWRFWDAAWRGETWPV
ncbi:thiaminase II [Patulibacter americanus]|uniref:thiaminase II n=1 Tax=Patulibacter americanus TaxID=588672 RepID=UPI0003B49B14|nr:thiaminase II [Patulibacter americanus]